MVESSSGTTPEEGPRLDKSTPSTPTGPKKSTEETILTIYNQEQVRFGGRIRHFFNNWCKISRDPIFLELIKGVHLEFSDIPYQNHIPRPYKFSDLETKLINEEIISLESRGIIEKVEPSEGQIISNIFQSFK